MLGLGFWEIVIIGLVGLIIVGPEKLPELAKTAAKFLNEMKRTASDFQSAINQEKDVFKEDIDRFQELAQNVKNDITQLGLEQKNLDPHHPPVHLENSDQLELAQDLMDSEKKTEKNKNEGH